GRCLLLHLLDRVTFTDVTMNGDGLAARLLDRICHFDGVLENNIGDCDRSPLRRKCLGEAHSYAATAARHNRGFPPDLRHAPSPVSCSNRSTHTRSPSGPSLLLLQN